LNKIEVNSLPKKPSLAPEAPIFPTRPWYYLTFIHPINFLIGCHISEVSSSLNTLAPRREKFSKRTTVAIMAANQTDDMSLPPHWLDLFLPLFFPQRTPSPTTQRNTESSAQTPAAQGVPQPPSTEMTEAITSPSKKSSH
jgi:hypothetical protein